jgi:probable F420-dependent oxidoreductase
MRFTFAESMCDPGQYVSLARTAEEVGFTSMTVPDSVCYPEEDDSEYPYTADGGREFLEGKPFIEPFILISSLAAVTERLRFTTFVLKLPIHEPVLVAKQAMSTAVMSGNRLGLGVGLSPWHQDYKVTHSAWKGRGKRLDEMIEIIRGLEGGEYFSYSGEFYDIQSIKMCPAPSEPIPILIGGHSDAALRRAARLGDGWIHAGGAPDDRARMLARLAELRREHGREGDAFEVHVLPVEPLTPDLVKDFEDQGVTDLVVPFRNPYEPDTMSLEQKLAAMRGFADQVIAKV